MRQLARKADAWIMAGLCVLLLLVIGAMGFLSSYKNTAGNAADAPARWPSDSRIEPEPGLPILVMFAHPMCSCTRASLSELRVLVSEFRGRFTPYVLSALPQGVGEEWMSSDLWKRAESIEGVRVMRDVEEYEAHLFGARTSGHVVLYDAAGRLLFSGGITSARGHVGDNYGLQQVASLLRKQTLNTAESPVFGCPLEDPQ
ncbi:MAG: RedB protein [Gaiellales bacterium]